MVRWFVLGLLACIAVLFLIRESSMLTLTEPDANPEPATNEVDVAPPGGRTVEPTPAPTRPPNSTARSETEVITFSSILDSKEMTRTERIKALQNLGPAALQKPAARNAIASDRPPGAAAQERRATRPRGPDEYDIKAAKRRVDVTMYSTSWCGVCKRAKAYFVDKGVDFTEYDVDKDERARAEYLRLNPRRSVPTITIDNEVLVGFSARSFEHLMNKAVQARLN